MYLIVVYSICYCWNLFLPFWLKSLNITETFLQHHFRFRGSQNHWFRDAKTVSSNIVWWKWCWSDVLVMFSDVLKIMRPKCLVKFSFAVHVISESGGFFAGQYTRRRCQQKLPLNTMSPYGPPNVCLKDVLTYNSLQKRWQTNRQLKNLLRQFEWRREGYEIHRTPEGIWSKA